MQIVHEIQQIQLWLRVAVGIIFCCLPLSSTLANSPLKMLGTCAGLTSFLVIEETYGKLARGEPIAKLNASEADAAAALALADAEERRKRGLEVEQGSNSGEKDGSNEDGVKEKRD